MEGTEYWSQEQSSTRILAGNASSWEVHETNANSALYSPHNPSGNNKSTSDSSDNNTRSPGAYASTGEGAWGQTPDQHYTNAPVFGAEIQYVTSSHYSNDCQYTGAQATSLYTVPSQPDLQSGYAMHSITPQPSLSTIGHPSPPSMEFEDTIPKHTPGGSFSSSSTA
jgi:hypothetical protein